MAYKSTGTENLKRLNKRLQKLTSEKGQEIANEVAKRAASVITSYSQASYDGGTTVYGDARPTGKHGNLLSLVYSGDTRSMIRFVSDGGSKIRASLGKDYMKYLIGKYRILPIGNAQLPFKWLGAIRLIFKSVSEEFFESKRAA
jgi:hypothetical protein